MWAVLAVAVLMSALHGGGKYGRWIDDLGRDDPDPEVVLAAAESPQERRNTDWAPRLLEIYAREDCPRATRMYELLTMASGRLASADLHRLFADAGPRGRNRILQLALNATLPL